MNVSEKLKYISSLISNKHYSEKEKITVIKSLINKDFDEDIRVPKYSLSQIKQQVEEHTGVSIDQMNQNTRDRTIVQARQFAHYKSKLFTLESLEFIGFYFGRKDHATVLHSKKTIEGLLQVDKTFREQHEQFLNE